MAKKKRKKHRRQRSKSSKRRKQNQSFNFESLEPRKLLACDVFQVGGDYCFDATGLSVEVQQNMTTIEIVDAGDSSVVYDQVNLVDVGEKIEIQNANTAIVNSELQLDGNSLEIDATGSIHVTGTDAVINTTDVGSVNATPGAGDVLFIAPVITIDQSASINTDDSGDADGDITLLADQTSLLGEDANGEELYHITLVDADLRGGTIEITANGETLTSWGDLGQFSNVIAEELESANQLGLSSVSPISGQAKLHSADAKILLSNTTIVSSGEVNILAEARADASLDAIAINATLSDNSKFLGAVGLGSAASDAKVDLLGDTSIISVSDISIKSNAESIATVNSRADGGSRLGSEVDTAFNISIAITNETSQVKLGSAASITGGSQIDIEALGKVVNNVAATTSLFEPEDSQDESNEAGLSLALGVDTANINATMEGDVINNGEFDQTAITPAFMPTQHVDVTTNEIIFSWIPESNPFVVGEKVTYASRGGDNVGLEEGREYIVYSVTEPVLVSAGRVEQRIRLLDSNTLEINSNQASPDSVHTISRIGYATTDPEETPSEDNFVHLANLPVGIEEVTYLGPDREADPDAVGIDGLEQNETYRIVGTSTDDRYRLQSLSDGSLVEFEVPESGRQGFYFYETSIAFNPRDAVDNQNNTIEVPGHGLSNGDLVFYGTDTGQSVLRSLHNLDDNSVGDANVPDAPIRGLSDEMGYRVVVDPDNPDRIRLATSTFAIGDGQVAELNNDSDQWQVLIRDIGKVKIRAHLDAENKADAGVAFSDKEQPWAEVTINASQGDIDSIASGGRGLIDSLRDLPEVNDDVVSFDQDASTPTKKGDKTSEFAASIAISKFDHDVTTKIGTSSVIDSLLELDIDATIEQATKISSVSETNRRGTGEDGPANAKEISAAIGVGVFNNDAQTVVKNGATIRTSGSIDVHAGIEYPLLASDGADAINPYVQFQRAGLGAFERIVDGSLGVSDVLNVSTRSTAGSAGDGFSFGGAVVVTDYTNNVLAYIGNSNIDAGRNVSVTADLSAELIEAGQMASMNVDLLGLLEGATAEDPVGGLKQLGSPFGVKGDKAIGGVALITLADNTTIAQVDSGATVNAGILTVAAESDFYNLSIVQTGADSTTAGFSAAIAASDITSFTEASVRDGANVFAILSVDANDNLDRINIVGGILKGKQVGIGTSIGVNVVNQTVDAFVGRQDTSPSLAAPTEANLDNLATSVTAQADGNIFSLVMAGAAQGLSSGTDDNSSGASGKTKSNKIGAVAITAPVAVNDVTTNVSAWLDQQLTTENLESLNVIADSNVNIQAVSVGAAFAVQTGASPGKLSLAGAGSVAVNTVEQNVAAFVKDSDLRGFGLRNIVANDSSTVEADAGGFGLTLAAASQNKAALSFGVSVAVNEVSGVTSANVQDSHIENEVGDLTISAQSDSTTKGVSIAGGISGKLGATSGAAFGGAGAAVQNQVTKTISSEIIGTNVNLPNGDLNVTATDTTTVIADAGGVGIGVSLGAASRVSASASVTPAFNEISNVVTASVEDANVNADSTSVAATSSSTIEAKSLAAAVDVTASSSPNPGVVIAGSGSQNSINNTIEANVADANLSTTRTTKVIAKDASTITASSEGASIGAIASAGGTGGVAVGLSIARSDIDNNIKATVERSSVSVGNIIVSANDQADIETEAIATSISATLAGGGTFNATGGGAEASNTSLSTIDALVVASDMSSEGHVSVYGLTNAKLKANVANVTTGVAGATGGVGTIAVGAAVANNSIGFDADGSEQESGATANIFFTPIVAESIYVEAGTHQPNVDGVCYANDDPSQRITASVSSNSVAVTGAAGVGAAGAGSGSRATNKINQNIEALVAGSTDNAILADLIGIAAVDTSMIKSDVGANAVAANLTGGTGGSLTLGLSLANNAVSNDVAATMVGNFVSPTETSGELEITATESATIEANSIAVGVAAGVSLGTGVTIAGGGASSINEIANITRSSLSSSGVRGLATSVQASSEANIDAYVGGHTVSGSGAGAAVVASIGVSLAENRIGGIETIGGNEVADGTARVSASIISSNIDSASVAVDAVSRDTVHADVAANSVAVAVGGVAGAGAGAGASAVNTAATVVESNLTFTDFTRSGFSKVESDSESTLTANVDSAAVAAALGNNAATLSVAVAKAENQIVNDVRSTVVGGDIAVQNLVVIAKENSSAESDAATVSLAGNLSLGGSINGGGAHSNSTVESSVTADVNNSDIDTSYLAVRAANTSNADSDTHGIAANAALGALGGQGSVSQSNIDQDVKAIVSGRSIDASNVDVEATSTPQATADAFGFSITTGGTVGVSSATTNIDGLVKASVGNFDKPDPINAGSLNVRSTLLTGSGSHAKANASGGGLAASAQAASSEITNGVDVEAEIEAGSTLNVTGATNVIADRDTKQTSEAKAISGGIVAAGITTASSHITGNTDARVGDDVALNGGSLNVEADGRDEHLSHTTAGAGGVVSGTAAVPTTTNISNTAATIGENANVTLTGSLTQTAEHKANVNSTLTAASGGLLTGGGGSLNNIVESDVRTDFGTNASITAAEIDARATNDVIKPTVAGGHANGATGGLIAGAGLVSKTELTLDTEVNVKDNSDLYSTTGSIDLHALNTIVARDQVSVRTGGVAAGGVVNATLETLADNATVNIEGDLKSEKEINVSARGNGDIVLQANSETYGAATVGAGNSVVDIKPVNTVIVGADAALEARRDLNLSAGTDANRNQDIYTISSRNDTFAGSLIPIEDVNASAILDQQNKIEVGNNASVRSGGEMRLHTEQFGINDVDSQAKAVTWVNALANGINSLLGQGGTEAYGGGQTTFEANGVVDVKPGATLETGIHRKHDLTITGVSYVGGDSSEDRSDPTNYEVETTIAADHNEIDFTRTLVEAESPLDEAIRKAREQRLEFYNDVALRAFYDEQIQILLTRQQDQGLAYTPSENNENGITVRQPKPVLSLSIDPTFAQAGAIDIRGDQLNSDASSSFIAPGDASVTITNNTPAFLELNAITIPEGNGGLYLNGVDRSSDYGISLADEPIVQIKSDLNLNTIPEGTDQYPWPGITVAMGGGITNRSGSLELTTYEFGGGSIRIEAPVIAKTQIIKAGTNGTVDINLRDPGTSFEVGGSEPERITEYIQDNGAPSFNGTVRVELNGSNPNFTNFLNEAPEVAIEGERIYITAEYINVNDIIQSGRSEYKLKLGPEAETEIQNGINAGRRGIQSLNNFVEGDANLGVSFDYDTNRIIVDELRVSGGYVDLTGRVTNTRNGEIQVLGEYASIEINNQTSFDLETRRLDTTQRGEGTVVIKDLAKSESSIYQQRGDQIELIKDGTQSWFEAGQRDFVYEPLAGQRLGWTVMQESSTVRTVSYETEALWGLINFRNPDPSSTTSTSRTVPRSSPANASNPRFFVSDTDRARYVYSRTTEGTYSNGPFIRNQRERWTGWGPWSTKIVNWDSVTQSGTQAFHRHDIAADRPIDVRFLGSSRSNIYIRSKGSVYLGDEISTSTGRSTVILDCTRSDTAPCSNDEFSITALSEGAIVGGQSVYMSAADDIGSIDRPIQTNLADDVYHDFDSTKTVDIYKGHRVLVADGHAAGGISGQVYEFLPAYGSSTLGNEILTIDLSEEDFSGTARWAIVDRPNADSVRAWTKRGNIDLEEISGEFRTNGTNANRDELRSNDGAVRITADSFAASTGEHITGDSLTLVARTGNIGESESSPLRVDYSNATQGIDDNVNLKAPGDIFLSHTNDLVVDSIIAGGEVWIDGNGTGALIDGNTLEEVDTRALSDLRANIWEALDLTNGDSRLGELRLQITVAQEAAYNEYWDLRQTQANSSDYDPTHEILIDGVVDQEKTDRYHALHAFDPGFVVEVPAQEQANIRELGEINGLRGAELDAYVDGEVDRISVYRTHRYREMHNMGAYGDIREEVFNYELPLADVEEIDSTKVWTEEELRSLRSRGFLEVTDTEFAIEENNITAGGDITIINSNGVGRYMNVRRKPIVDAEGEVVGSYLDYEGTTIELTDDDSEPTVLTLDERAAIDTAEPNDIIYLTQAPVSVNAELKSDNTITFLDEFGMPDMSQDWNDYGFELNQNVYLEATRDTTDEGLFYRVVDITGHVMTLAPPILPNSPGTAPLSPADRLEELISDIKLAPVALNHSDATHIRVLHREDVDFTAGGVVNVDSNRQLFIGSETNLRVNRAVTDADQRVQIKVKGDLTSTHSANNLIAGQRVVLESSTGAIEVDNLNVTSKGYLIARSNDHIEVEHQSLGEFPERLPLNQIFSKTSHVDITSDGSIVDRWGRSSALNIKAADDIILTSTEGSIGQPFLNGYSNSLEIDLGENGSLTANAATDVYLTETNGDLNLQSVYATGLASLEVPTGGIYNSGSNGGHAKVGSLWLAVRDSVGQSSALSRRIFVDADHFEAESRTGDLYVFSFGDMNITGRGISAEGSVSLWARNQLQINADIVGNYIGTSSTDLLVTEDATLTAAGRIDLSGRSSEASQLNILGHLNAEITVATGSSFDDYIFLAPASLSGRLTASSRGGNDEIHGSDFVDSIFGGDGDDVIHANAGDDFIDGGEGCDSIYSGAGLDTIVNPDSCDSYGELNFENQNAIERSMVNGDSVGDLAMAPSNADDQLTFVLEDNVDGLLAIVGNQVVIADALKIRQHEGQQISFTVRVDHGEGGTTTRTFTLDIAWHDVAEVLEERTIVGDGTEQRSHVNRLQVTFAGPVDIDEGAFALTHRGSSAVVATTWTTDFDESGNSVVTLTFEGDQTRATGALIDGNYELIVDPTKVRRTGTTIDLDGDADGESGGSWHFGDDSADNFFAHYGAFTGSRRVAIFDLLEFRRAYNSEEGDERYDPQIDFQGDGKIDIFDLLAFRKRYLDELTFQ